MGVVNRHASDTGAMSRILVCSPVYYTQRIDNRSLIKL